MAACFSTSFWSRMIISGRKATPYCSAMRISAVSALASLGARSSITAVSLRRNEVLIESPCVFAFTARV